MIRILGVDPGSRVTGYGVITVEGNHHRYVASGCVRAGAGPLPERLGRIHAGLRELIETHRPDEVAVEKVFVYRSAGLVRLVTKRGNDAQEALDKLEQAKDQLVESEKLASLGQLVGGLAHELNTPIGVSLNAADVLADEARELRTKFETGQLKKSFFTGGIKRLIEAAGLVRSNATRAAELIKSFKGVAVDQANAGVRDIQLKPYLQQVLTSLGPYTKREKLTVDVVGPDVGMRISAGPLSQVVTNLVQNAAVHAYQGQGGHLDIMISLNRPDWVDLTIRDRGVGIPEDALSRVFEPLFTTRFGSGGSGLGFHICYQTVSELLHGTITVESRLGEGTEFMIQLPINRQNLMLVDEAPNADHFAV